MTEQNTPALIIVGGFLGAGKTTLILKAAELLRKHDKRVGVILNDQDAGLVDTEHAVARDVIAREVTDGCFCCRFSELVAATGDLMTYRPDVIFAEPVGSCIDLTATVMRPLQTIHPGQFRIAPLTVLLDPDSADQLRDDRLDPNIRYLLANQLAEADLVCTTKQDLHRGPVAASVPIDFQLSGKTGFGVESWLHEMLQPTRVVGAHLLDVNYDRYAEAEAALGWLNLHANIRLPLPRTPALLCGPLLDELEQQLSKAGIVIAHLKIFDRTATAWVKASVSTNGGEPVPEGDLMADPAAEHEFALNLRAVADPDHLRRVVLAGLDKIAGQVEIRHLRAFRPPAPKPEHRLVS